jgi:hypothetical protein
VEIDHQDGISRSRIDLGVPTVMKRIAERSLRAAVDQQCQGILLGGVEVRRLDHVGVDLFLVVPPEGELLEVAHPGGGDLCGVEAGEPVRLRAVRPDPTQFRRRFQAAQA